MTVMPSMIEFLAGFESRTYPLRALANTSFDTVNITGWSWWTVASVSFILINPGAAPAATGNVVIFDSGNRVYASYAVQSTGAATAEELSWGLAGGFFGVAGVGAQQALPWLFNIGEGQVQWGFAGGAVGTTVSAGFLTIIGRQFRNRK